MPHPSISLSAIACVGVCWLVGCSAAPPPSATTESTPRASSEPDAAVPTPSTATASTCPEADCAQPPAAAPVIEKTPAKPFTLAAFAPPYERSAQPGDGTWQSVPEVGTVDGSPLALRTTVHPHPIRKDVSVAIIAFDLERSELVWVPGRKEPESAAFPAELRKGVVPKHDHDKLLAAFNGGFMARHGRFGAMLDGHELIAPRDGACTIAFPEAGGLAIAPWEDLKGQKLASLRQTPPCLVNAGALHERLAIEPKKWGLSAEGKDEIRRSALGIDETRKVLFFGLGEWVLPKEAALAMKLAGARTAAELDINWSYTRFNFYGRKGAGEPLTVIGTLVPQLVHTKGAYVTDLAERDFFYVRKK